MKNIGVSIMRCMPPHKGHVSIIKNLSTKFDEVYIFLCGNTQSENNPFSFHTRWYTLQYSYDKIHNVNIIEAKDGFLPDLIKNNIPDYKSCKLNIVVGQDRLDDFKDQLERTKFDGNYEIFYADSIKLNDSDEFRISGTSIREALINDDFNFVKSCLSETLGDKQFLVIYNLLRKELGQWVRLKGKAFDSLKHINHAHELKDDEFREFLLDLIEFQLIGSGIEVSEKVDGFCQLQFGIINGKLYTKGKSDKLFFDAKDHTKPIFQEIHSLLKKKEKQISRIGLLVNGENWDVHVLQDGEDPCENFIWPQYFIEVLDSKVPNVIPYHPNQIIFFKASFNGFDGYPDKEKKTLDLLLNYLPNSIIFNKNRWYLKRKKTFDYTDKLEYIDFNSWLTLWDNNEIPKEEIKLFIYHNIIDKWITDRTSKFGSNKDGYIEGLVFRNKDCITKVTDANIFGKLKDILWHHREYLEDTIRNEFCKKIVKLSGIKSLWNKNLSSAYLKKQLKNDLSHKNIQNYIVSNNCFTLIDKKDVVIATLFFLNDTLNELVKFNDKWIEYRDNPENQVIELNEREIPFYQECKDRTDRDIATHLEYYCELIRRFSKLNKSKINDDLKLVSVLKWIYLN